MHHLGFVTEQLSHQDPDVELARRHARQRRDARRARREATADRPGPALVVPVEKVAARKHLFFDWHGLLAHHH
jgi:hypothetical protein